MDMEKAYVDKIVLDSAFTLYMPDNLMIGINPSISDIRYEGLYIKSRLFFYLKVYEFSLLTNQYIFLSATLRNEF